MEITFKIKIVVDEETGENFMRSIYKAHIEGSDVGSQVFERIIEYKEKEGLVISETNWHRAGCFSGVIAEVLMSPKNQ